MFILRTTADENGDCGPDFSCMTLDHSNQPPSHAMTTDGSTDAHQHMNARNFIGLIIATTVILVGLCVWRICIMWKKKGREGCCGRKKSEASRREKRGREQKIADDAMRWTMGTDGQVVRPEKALKTGYGNGWKITNSAPWRDEEQRELKQIHSGS